jgi:hypothetical protein
VVVGPVWVVPATARVAVVAAAVALIVVVVIFVAMLTVPAVLPVVRGVASLLRVRPAVLLQPVYEATWQRQRPKLAGLAVAVVVRVVVLARLAGWERLGLGLLHLHQQGEAIGGSRKLGQGAQLSLQPLARQLAARGLPPP